MSKGKYIAIQEGDYVVRVSTTPQRKILVALWLHCDSYKINQNKKQMFIGIDLMASLIR